MEKELSNLLLLCSAEESKSCHISFFKANCPFNMNTSSCFFWNVVKCLQKGNFLNALIWGSVHHENNQSSLENWKIEGLLIAPIPLLPVSLALFLSSKGIKDLGIAIAFSHGRLTDSSSMIRTVEIEERCVGGRGCVIKEWWMASITPLMEFRVYCPLVLLPAPNSAPIWFASN